MKKRLLIFDKLKKMLIVLTCVLALGAIMPKKTEAAGIPMGILSDFVNIVLFIPDAAMDIIDSKIAASNEFTSAKVDFKGWDAHGRIYNFVVTPYEIFTSGTTFKGSDGKTYVKLGIFDANFFRTTEVESGSIVSSQVITPVIGNVYKSLRNFCMVLMLIVLLYMGIRIMLSSIAEQQAKYKQLLVDWLVGFCLLFLMHYIMAFIASLNTMAISFFNNEDGDTYYVGFQDLEADGSGTKSSWVDIANGSYTQLDVNIRWVTLATSTVNVVPGVPGYVLGELITNGLDKNGIDTVTNLNGDDFKGNEFIAWKATRLCVNADNTDSATVYSVDNKTGKVNLKGHKNVCFPSTDVDLKKWGDDGEVYLSASIGNPEKSKEYNKAIVKMNLLSYLRTVSSFSLEDERSVSIYDGNGCHQSDEVTAMAYGILYLALAIEVVMFAYMYIKRVIQLAFYTMIAPLVALMYPIDKIGDGKAQAFNTWFKDYLYTVLIQPLHLLLYTIFIFGEGQLLKKNVIYALVMYAFMIVAEKYFKKILGFDKAPSGGPGGMGDAFGRMLAMEGLGKLAGIGPAATRGGSGGGKAKERRKPKLSKSDITNRAASGGSDFDGGSGRAESGGNLIINASGAGSGSGRKDKKGGAFDPNARAQADGNKKKGPARLLGGAIGRSAVRGLSGGKAAYFGQPGAAQAIVSNLGGKAIKGGLRAGSRIAGAVSGGTIGLVAGAATAIATGDIGNIAKGIGVGAAAGDKIGNNIYGMGEDAFTDLAENYKLEKANSDDEYREKLRKEEAYGRFANDLSDMQDVGMRKKMEKVIDTYSPYINFSDIKQVEAIASVLDDSNDPNDPINSASIDIIEAYKDANSYSDLQYHQEQYERDIMTKLENKYRKDNNIGGEALTAEQMRDIQRQYKREEDAIYEANRRSLTDEEKRSVEQAYRNANGIAEGPLTDEQNKELKQAYKQKEFDVNEENRRSLNDAEKHAVESRYRKQQKLDSALTLAQKEQIKKEMEARKALAKAMQGKL